LWQHQLTRQLVKQPNSGDLMDQAHYAAILLNIYSLAIGFTAAGVCASVSAMVTGQPLRFEMRQEHASNLSLLAGAACRIIAGPFMILRNTLQAILFKGSEPYWIMVAIIIACLWSFCQGVIILETACQLGACSG